MSLPRAQVLLPLDPGHTRAQARTRLSALVDAVGLYPVRPHPGGPGLCWYCLECGCSTYASVSAAGARLTSSRLDYAAVCRQSPGEAPRCRCHMLPSGWTSGAGSVMWRRAAFEADMLDGEPAAADPVAASVLCTACALDPVLAWIGRSDGDGPLLGWYCARCAGMDLPRRPGPGDLAAARTALEFAVALGAPPPRIHAGF